MVSVIGSIDRYGSRIVAPTLLGVTSPSQIAATSQALAEHPEAAPTKQGAPSGAYPLQQDTPLSALPGGRR